MGLKRNKRKGKYWFHDVKPDGTVYEVYLRRFVHADGVSRAVSSTTGFKGWEEKKNQHFIDAKNNPNGVVKDYKNATLLVMSIPYLESRETKSIGNYIRVK